MVDPLNRVVIVVYSGSSVVLFQSTGSSWGREAAAEFSSAIAELGSFGVQGVLQAGTLTFTVDGVDYSYNTSTRVITPDLEVE